MINVNEEPIRTFDKHSGSQTFVWKDAVTTYTIEHRKDNSWKIEVVIGNVTYYFTPAGHLDLRHIDTLCMPFTVLKRLVNELEPWYKEIQDTITKLVPVVELCLLESIKRR